MMVATREYRRSALPGPTARAAARLLAMAVLALSASATAAQEARTHEQMHQLHQDPQAYAAALDDPRRDAYQKPDEVVAALALKAGEAIADIGAGTGYFTLRLARAVGPTGRVYAVDVDPGMLRHFNRRLRDMGLDNVRSVLADPDDPLLPAASVDRVFICDTWHHIEDPARYLGLLKTMLRPGGQIVMIDFQKRELPVGPPASMKIAREELVAQLKAAGFRLAAEHTFLPYQYFLVFEPSGD
jgi:ubiquinone/menaquinone biosynthesis C-methylase UbiE